MDPSASSSSSFPKGGELPPSIRKLDLSTVNKIAAGEVILRPANALKELMENSLDAKATSISVVLKQGGLKILHIQDNGCGIRVEDFPILCERFTTSKIKTYKDLNGIQSFGFRGEALASISHVAHLTITSKTSDATCAYRASYSDGKLIASSPGEEAKPQPVAGVKGTTILAEDLFYNIPIRRESLRSAAEEYRKCVNVVTKYAVHYSGVSFTCKKQGQKKMDVHTLKNANLTQNIRTLYGSNISRELITVKASSKEFRFQMHALTTNPNFNAKSFTLILFINNRLVQCASIKKMIDTVYRDYLPSHTYPFVYLSLKINPSNVDVNVHPTKREVHFLHEEQIVEELQAAFEKALNGTNCSRVFFMQTLLPGAPAVKENMKEGKNSEETGQAESSSKKENPIQKSVKRVYEHKLVRTDSRNPIGRLDAYLRHPKQSTLSRRASMGKVPRTNLTSVRELHAEIESSSSEHLKEIFSDNVFVGCVDEIYTLLQHETKLFLVDVPLLSQHLFYERVLLNFGCMNHFRLSRPAPIHQMILLILETEASSWKKEDGDKSTIATKLTDLLISKSQMLSEYFSIDINGSGELTALPEIISNYVPPMGMLPQFLFRLSLQVNWYEEKSCFRDISHELAKFYRVYPKKYINHSVSADCSVKNKMSLKWVIQHTIIPELRVDFHPPKEVEKSKGVIKIASLENLYKIFERC